MKLIFFNILYSFLFSSFILFSENYFYNVAQIDNNNFIYMEQKSGKNMQVVLFNKTTNEKEKLLSSSYNPFGVKLLLDKSGFSFIDNGRIRIKKFNKRCPQSLDLYYPLYNFTLLHWLDNFTFYISAKYCNNYGIYQIDINGNILILLEKEGVDYLYPQKIDDLLFYVERINNSYSIKKVFYPQLNDNCLNIKNLSFDEKVSLLMKQENKKKIEINEQQSLTIFDKQKKPILFLTMISENMGFYLTHKPCLDVNNKVVNFSYHQIKVESGVWKDQKLFSFTAPLRLFLYGNEAYLRESILPLVPTYNNKKNMIEYFIVDNDNNFNKYYYHLSS